MRRVAGKAAAPKATRPVSSASPLASAPRGRSAADEMFFDSTGLDTTLEAAGPVYSAFNERSSVWALHASTMGLRPAPGARECLDGKLHAKFIRPKCPAFDGALAVSAGLVLRPSRSDSIGRSERE